MPKGVYARKPYMRTYGKTAGMRDAVLLLLKIGKNKTWIAREMNVSRMTIYRLQVGNWGNKKPR